MLHLRIHCDAPQQNDSEETDQEVHKYGYHTQSTKIEILVKAVLNLQHTTRFTPEANKTDWEYNDELHQMM